MRPAGEEEDLAPPDHIQAIAQTAAFHNTGRTILTPLAGHGATRAFFNTVEAAMRRGGNRSHMSKTDT